MPDMSDSAQGPAVRPDGLAADSIPSPTGLGRPRRARGSLWLALFTLLAIGAAATWYRYGPAPEQVVPPDAPSAPDSAPASAPVEDLRRSLEDAARVNRALREQVLGLTQRVGLVEDGLAGVERGAAPGVDAVRMAEADFLLRLGEERLRLFADVGGARSAFELADAQLTEVSDPRATSVRQTLALERDALAAVAVADLPAVLGRLDGLAAAVEAWPLKGRSVPAGNAEPNNAARWWSRLSGALDRYFRVRRIDPAEHASGGPLLRERIALDLSRARLLLLRSEGAAARDAIEAVRSAVRGEFDDQDIRVIQALTVLDELRSAPLAPLFPTLGESRRELARLRGVADPATQPNTDQAMPAPAASGTEVPQVLPGELTPEQTVPEATPELAPEAAGSERDIEGPAASPESDDAVPDDGSAESPTSDQDA